MSIRSRTRAAAAALLCAAALSAAWFATRANSDTTPFSFQFRWPVGAEYRYRVHWTSDQRTRAPIQGAPEMQIESGFEADLVLRSVVQRGDVTELAVSFEDLGRAVGSFQGQPVTLEAEAAAAAFSGHVAVAEVGADGALRALRFRQDDPTPFKRLTDGVLRQSQLLIPWDGSLERAGRWSAVERGEAGMVAAEYEAVDDAPPTVVRTRTAYRSIDLVPGDAPPHRVDAKTQIVLAPEGHLRSVQASEALDLVGEPGGALLHMKSRFEMELERVGRFELDGAMLAGITETRRPGEPAAPQPGTERVMLEMRAGGMTMDALEDDLLTRVVRGRIADQNAWFGRAVGVLRLHPERCKELAPIFARPALEKETRALILDLLAAAGHPQAQAVLRELIDSPAAKRTPDEQVALLQRLSLVREPAPETLRYAIDRFRSEKGLVRTAGAYALGSVLGRSEQADPALAGEARKALLEPLRAASSREEKVNLLRAVGNAGLAEAQPDLLAAARSEDPEVRLAAAAGMRKVGSPECTAALLSLAEDPQSFVRIAALDGLRGRALAGPELDVLARIAAAPGLGDEAASMLVGLLEARPAVDAGARQVLAALLGRQFQDQGLRARAQQLLARGS